MHLFIIICCYIFSSLSVMLETFTWFPPPLKNMQTVDWLLCFAPQCRFVLHPKLDLCPVQVILYCVPDVILGGTDTTTEQNKSCNNNENISHLFCY